MLDQHSSVHVYTCTCAKAAKLVDKECTLACIQCPQTHAHVHVQNYCTVLYVIHVHVHVLLTDDDCQDDQDYDDEDDPQLHILPPQLALETSGRALEHVGILVEVV